jgi:hypothetical protein
MSKGKKCKCGEMPVMDKLCGDNGTNYNGVQFRLECPKCGAKGAPWLKSQLFACSQWESEYWNH